MLSSRSLAVSFLLFARARHIDLLVELDNRFNGRFENVNDTPHTDADPHTATGTAAARAGSATGAGGIGDRRGRDRRPARPVAAEQEPPQEDRLRDARARVRPCQPQASPEPVRWNPSPNPSDPL